MRRAILFRYHTRPDICLNRIAHMRQLNPHIAIYGMYGGKHAYPPPLPFDHNYVLPFESSRFKWQHGDLCARRWFIDVGHRFPFDMLHLIEWDLVLLKPVDKLYRHVRDGVAATGLRTIHQWRRRDWWWLKTPEGDAQLQTLRAFALKKCGKRLEDEEQLAGLFPGASMSRAFLERYAAIDPPALLNDEIRMPLFAQVFGMKVRDTGFYKNNPYLDCNKRSASRPAALTKYKVLHHMRRRVR